MKKTWIKIKRGLLEPKHRRKLGAAWFLYLYMLDIANWEDGIIYDWKDENAAQELDFQLYTLREHRKKLEDELYIKTNQKQYGQDIAITNWTNPREYSGQVYNAVDQGLDITQPQNSQGLVQGEGQGGVQGLENTRLLHHTHINHISHNTLNTVPVGKKIIEPVREPCDFDGITESMELGYGGKRKKEKKVIHVAIDAYRSATGRYPNKALWDQIIEVVGNDPDVAFMKECYVSWCKISQNPSPYKWLFEWYRNGEITLGFNKKDVVDPEMERMMREGSKI